MYKKYEKVFGSFEIENSEYFNKLANIFLSVYDLSFNELKNLDDYSIKRFFIYVMIKISNIPVEILAARLEVTFSEITNSYKLYLKFFKNTNKNLLISTLYNNYLYIKKQFDKSK